MATAGLSLNIFEKCLPAFTADIKPCSNVTTCNISPATKATLESFFHDGTYWKIFGALITAEFEINSCDVEINGLYELIMATRRDWSKKVNFVNLEEGLYEIKPYVMGAQKSVLNNEYWTFTNGQANGGNWQVDATSQSNMPLDTRWFNAPEVVFLFGKSSGGSAIETAYKLVSATVVGSVLRLVMTSQNSNSSMPSAKVGDPTSGYLIRGVGNIDSYESWCLEGPAMNLNKRVPFWIQRTRLATCDDQLFRRYQDALVRENALFRTFKNVDSVQRNQQLGNDFKKRMVNYFFYGKALANQDLTNYGSLETITSATPSALVLPGTGKCVGRRANAVGVIEQLWACGRGSDLQGNVLNLMEYFQGVLYDISRVRSPSDDGRIIIESWTGSRMAALIQAAMIKYYNKLANDKMVANLDFNGAAKQGSLGFWYRDYFLDYPVVCWRVSSHRYFDDLLTAATTAGSSFTATGNLLWTLDWSTMYMAILGSDRKVNNIGNIDKISQIDTGLACVMKFPENTYTLTETTFTNVVECPRANHIIRNMALTIPEHAGVSGPGSSTDYYGLYQSTT
jgi:hypothetical protein